jgi:hypothetical protein
MPLSDEGEATVRQVHLLLHVLRRAHPGRATALLAVVATAALVASPRAGASTPPASPPGSGTTSLAYHGISITVPATWSVVHLSADPTRCVRFDVHAIYLGQPGTQQRCPSRLLGQTEAALVEPLTEAEVQGDMAGLDPTQRGSETVGVQPRTPAQRDYVLLSPRAHAEVSVTVGRDAATASHVFDSISTSGAPAAGSAVGTGPDSGPQPNAHAKQLTTATAEASRASLEADVSTDAAPAIAASGPSVYTGLGFDACTAPSESTMQAWLSSSPYRSIGIYIGGESRACSQPNLTSTWVNDVSAMGWHLLPIYVGLQASCNGFPNEIDPGSAFGEGQADADAAAADAASLGLGTGNPVYFDMEGFNIDDGVCTGAVQSFLNAWTQELHADGYVSGVYGSSGSTMVALVDAVGTPGFVPPDDIWFAEWNGVADTSSAYIPSNYWIYNQRLHQYAGGHDETWGGVTINIDSDYDDGLLAGSIGNGSFVSTPDGNVWRIVGDAPILVTDMSQLAIFPPVTPVPDLSGFLDKPQDGTLVSAEPSGEVFRFVGGAPVYISDWNGIGGLQPTISINDASLTPFTLFSLGHVNNQPADASFVLAEPSGEVFRFVGGAPVYISDWNGVGGIQPAVVVNDASLSSSTQFSFGHVAQYPANGSFVSAEPSGEVFRFVGGAPLYITDWNGVGGIQPAVVVNDASLSSSTQFSFGHVAQYPANGSFVSAEPSGRVYRFAGGAPLYISSWDLFGGVQPYVVVNDGTLSSASQYSFGHLRASPEDGTVVEGLPSQTYWVFQNGAVSPTAPVAGAVQVNDFSVTPFVSEPAVTSVSPDVVPAAGGSTVTISGNGFEGATKVSFGSSPASSFSVTSPTSITALAPAGSGTVDVTVSSSSGTSATSGADKVLYAAPGSYHPLGPTRVLDTRNGTGGHSGALGAGQSLSLQLSGTGHPVPQGATAAVLNLVATDATAASYLTAYPSGEAVPGASNLNFGAGETLSNLVVVALSPTGSVSIYNNSGSTDVVADLEGYMGAPSSSAGRFNPLSPARILDTRADLGHTGALGPGQSIELKVTGNGGVPASGVSAVELNLTAAYATASSYLSVFPAGQALPGTSNLNFGPGEPLPLPNRVIVAVGSGGQISIYNNSGFTDVVADVGGWYSDSSTSSGDLFTPVSPTRILDTRSGTGHSGPLGPGSSIGLAVAGTDGIPSDAAAVVANTTVTDTSASSFLTLYPWGQSPPGTSDLNWSAGETIANLTLPPTGSGGQVGIFNQAGFADVVADVEGWYSP